MLDELGVDRVQHVTAVARAGLGPELACGIRLRQRLECVLGRVVGQLANHVTGGGVGDVERLGRLDEVTGFDLGKRYVARGEQVSIGGEIRHRYRSLSRRLCLESAARDELRCDDVLLNLVGALAHNHERSVAEVPLDVVLG